MAVIKLRVHYDLLLIDPNTLSVRVVYSMEHHWLFTSLQRQNVSIKRCCGRALREERVATMWCCKAEVRVCRLVGWERVGMAPTMDDSHLIPLHMPLVVSIDPVFLDPTLE